MKRILLAFILVIVAAPAAWAKVNVFVSIIPQAYFVERIGGSEVNVQVLVGPGQSPETYDPSPKQMAQLAQADVYFPIGVPFEFRLMKKIKRSFPDLNVVESQRGISLRAGEVDHHDGHRPDFNIDPHIWLDPQKARIMSSTMTDELARLRPDLAETFRANLAQLAADLDQLHRDLTAQLKPYKGCSFMVFHPAYGYFAGAYGLNQIAVEAEGKSPNAKQLAEWIDFAKKEKVKVIFVQPQFSQDTARTIAASIDGVVVPMDPLAKDYINNLRKMATAIAESMP
ncbi:MAG TPA: zinc ABC transporter substrate-binding protein [bacterium]|nr:zinc ABC transporter substrate-binding protein [bacterium]